MRLEKTGKKSIFKKPWFWIISIVVAIGGFAISTSGSTSDDLQGSIFDSSIDLVKNGTPTLIPDITYQQAYEDFFGNPQWRGFTSETGDKIVEFVGDCTYYDKDAQVYIQFLIQDTEFSMYYAHINLDGETITMEQQDFVELVYTPFASYSEKNLGKELDDDAQDAFEQIYESYN